VLLGRVLKLNIPVILAYPKSEMDIFFDNFAYSIDREVRHFVGSEENVLERMYMAAKRYDIDPIIRITHDNVLQFPELIKSAIQIFKKDVGFTSGDVSRYLYIPNGIPGTKFEIISFDLLEKCYKKYQNRNTDYLTYAFRDLAEYKVRCKQSDLEVEYIQNINLALDYPLDLLLLNILYDQNIFKLKDIKELGCFIRANPSIMAVNHRPKISIYTCAYNAEKTIGRTIQSVVDQQFKDWEYIIYDDGSTDATFVKLLYLQSCHQKIQIIRNAENKGLAFASNKAIKQTKGKYILRLDADDTLLPEALEVMIAEIEKDNEIGIVYGGFWKAEKIEEDNLFRSPFFAVNHNNIGCALIRRDLWEEVKFRDDLKYADGLDFYMRAKKLCKIVDINTPLWVYNQRPDSMSHTGGEEREKVYKEIKDAKPE